MTLTSLLSSNFKDYTDYTIEFDAEFRSGATNRAGGNSLTLVSTGSSDIFKMATPSTQVNDGNLVFTVTGAAEGKEITLSPLTWYHFKFDITSTSVTYTVTLGTDGSAVTNGSDSLTITDSRIKQVYFGTARNGGQTRFDNIDIYTMSAVDVVSDPTIAVTAVNGAKRTITITGGSSSAGNDVTTYYTTDGIDPTSSSSTYSAPFEVSSACTIKAITISSGDVASNITSFDVTAGEVKLGTPTITRTGAKTYTISVPEVTTDGFTADQTIHYTISGGAEQTGTSLTNVNGNIVAWATATGFTNSDNAEMTYVKAYELASEPTWSYNLNSYPSAHSCTAIADALSTTSKEIQSTMMYNLKEEDYPNLYIENGGGGLLRNRTSNAWKAQTAIQSIGFDNVTTTDVIYIHASKDGGGNGINSVTNGTVKYSYSDDYYYIVPTEDGSVKVAFNTGTSLNTVGVYKQVVSATLGANGYSTFASTYPLDMTKTTQTANGFKAYSAKVEGTSVRFTQIDKWVNPGIGVLLEGEKGGSVNIPVTYNGNDLENNDFLVNTSGTTFTADAGYTYYGMMRATTADEPIVFGTFAPGSVAIPADKAYLKVASNNSRLNVVFSDEATGIKTVQGEGVMVNGYYDLQGRRVAQPAKGLYIVNGKKMVVK